MNIEPFYDETVKVEDPTSSTVLKRPTRPMVEDPWDDYTSQGWKFCWNLKAEQIHLSSISVHEPSEKAHW